MLLDLLIILLVVAGVAFGFWRGIIPLALAIMGIYLGALLARFIYEPVAQAFVQVSGFNVGLARLLVFLLILILVPVLLIILAHTIWGTLRLPQKWGQVDLLGGSLLGAVFGLMAAMVLVLAVGFLVTTSHLSDTQGYQYPFFEQIRATWMSSLLRAPIVQIGHLFYYALLPNAGKSVPDILQVLGPR